ncbi:alanine--tRNA ligase [Candidatus Daviesbacteria bacterium]|nr:alanine--tRNA ligase [Candidatus Daviesbacteria bacterium]
MDSKTLREKFLKFFENNGHTIIPSAPLVPSDEEQLVGKERVLFTGAGMQPLIPYLMGKLHPKGNKLADVQKCVRTDDIEQVGDATHHTFFEMLGNWSLGDYWKDEAIKLSFEFLTKELEIPIEKLAISVFAGDDDAPRDEESVKKWRELGIPEKRIAYLGKEANWWPTGEKSGPCGPDTEMFIWTGEGSAPEEFDPKNPKWVEVWNDVFMEFNRKEDGTLEDLPQKNVDTGMGLERMLAVINGKDNDYQTDLFLSVINNLELFSGYKYGENTEVDQAFRIIADHMKAATFLIKDEVLPNNKLQGYVLRRLIRRAAVKSKRYFKYDLNLLANLSSKIVAFYHDTTDYFEYQDLIKIHSIIFQEVKKFEESLSAGLREIDRRLNKYDTQGGWLDSPENAAKFAFDLYQTYGLPMDAYFDDVLKKFGIAYAWGQKEDLYKEFEKLRNEHADLSRNTSAGMFKGGLADHSEVVTKYHTATHLLHQALRDVLGPEVFQKGSNITSERLRFDFSYDKKMTDDEIKKTEDIINKRIDEDLKVDHMIIPLDEAKKMNAIGLFDEKYADKVSIYGVGLGYGIDSQAKDQRDRGGYYSLEFCGGPHVEQTGTIGKIKITKEEAISAGIRRIRAQIVSS